MIQLTIKRINKSPAFTTGELYIDNVYFCETLEDTDRLLDDSMTEQQVSVLKIYGDTAIPSGTYDIDMDTVSPKFKNKTWAQICNGKLPRLKNVKGFSGVLIHVGNSTKDTLGCILVGEKDREGRIKNSAVTFKKLMTILVKDSDVKLTIL